jgi:phenylpropionate dioxygenase-like ring-hydroxylating dioxygenase large terminal subunit
VTRLPPNIAKSWLPVALSKDVAPGPTARRIAGVPIVLFRSNGLVSAFVDRCPHRNYPLSEGRVRGGLLECPYHGWRFDGSGACRGVPGHEVEAEPGGRTNAEPVAVSEQHGAIFVRASSDGPAAPELPPLLGEPGYDVFWWSQAPWRGRALDAVENVLDPFHTNFIHDGLIRQSHRRQPVALTINLFEDGLEAVYDQAKPDGGWMPRMLEGPRQRSRGRFFPPATVQARWEGPKQMTLAVTAFFTPETEASFRPFACFITPKGRAPAFVKERLIRLFLDPVVTQDREALAKQFDTMEAFGGPRFHQGPLDRFSAKITALYQGERLAPETLGPFTVML